MEGVEKPLIVDNIMFKKFHVLTIIFVLLLIFARCGKQTEKLNSLEGPSGARDSQRLTESAKKKQEKGAYVEADQEVAKVLEIKTD